MQFSEDEMDAEVGMQYNCLFVCFQSRKSVTKIEHFDWLLQVRIRPIRPVLKNFDSCNT